MPLGSDFKNVASVIGVKEYDQFPTFKVLLFIQVSWSWLSPPQQKGTFGEALIMHIISQNCL